MIDDDVSARLPNVVADEVRLQMLTKCQNTARVLTGITINNYALGGPEIQGQYVTVCAYQY